MIIHRGLVAALLAAVVVSSGADTKDAKTAESKKGGAKAPEKKDAVPACMHCGATCGLAPACVCEPGTKKQPKVEFDVTCEPVCIPACAHDCWPFGGHAAGASCTSCCAEPCECKSRVRWCKKIKKETTDEEVAIVERKVKYVCDCCAGRSGGCCGTTPRPRPPAWWTSLTWWWPRKPAE
jgi:hypothetical protein